MSDSVNPEEFIKDLFNSMRSVLKGSNQENFMLTSVENGKLDTFMFICSFDDFEENERFKNLINREGQKMARGRKRRSGKKKKDGDNGKIKSSGS